MVGINFLFEIVASVKKLILPKHGSSGRFSGRDSLEVSIAANGTGLDNYTKNDNKVTSFPTDLY